MTLPPHEAARAALVAAHGHAERAIGLTCHGPLVWGSRGRTLGRQAGPYWIKVTRSPRRGTARAREEGLTGAVSRVPREVPRPVVHEVHHWSEGEYAFEAELLGLVPQPPLSLQGPALMRDPALPQQWWDGLHQSLRLLAGAEARGQSVPDAWCVRAFTEVLGIPAPSLIERVTGHGDLHWGNLTGTPLTLLGWDHWGRVPVGYDAGLLHAGSLLVPAVAARVREEFAAVLDTPAGRIGELAALAVLLRAVAHGWGAGLSPRLRARAEELTGIRPPVAAPRADGRLIHPRHGGRLERRQ
ncbi:hypothetical protein ACTVZO_05915 [Streptomyces sp. IBSNAI002]|uniref:hypothetical protein n=1 Tax=Streptomyces sp. IBSNAI002 TaxID=3457500 RepID=UPI003FD3484E